MFALGRREPGHSAIDARGDHEADVELIVGLEVDVAANLAVEGEPVARRVVGTQSKGSPSRGRLVSAHLRRRSVAPGSTAQIAKVWLSRMRVAIQWPRRTAALTSSGVWAQAMTQRVVIPARLPP